jgi:signal peptidase I
LGQGGAADPVSRRVPWRAALLSLAVAGLGELYSGRPYRAIILNAFALLAGLACLKLLFIPLQPWNIVAPLLMAISAWLFILGDAIRCARRAPREYRLKAYNRWYVYVLLIIVAGMGQHPLKSVIHSQFLRAFKNPTESMSPTLLIGDRFLVDESAYVGITPKIGDIIAFRVPTNPSIVYVKRIVATGGDVMKVRDEKTYTNGRPLNEPFVRAPSQPVPLRDDFPPDINNVSQATLVSDGFDGAWVHDMSSFVHSDGLHVPPGNFFVMGDNRLHSYDSRYWGFVPRADILGKVRAVYFSWDAATRHVRWDRIGEVLR